MRGNLIAADSPTSFLDDTPTARPIRQVLGAVSEFEKDMVVAKLRDVLLWDGQIELHQHAAALAYAKLRRKAQSLDFARMKGCVSKATCRARGRATPGRL